MEGDLRNTYSLQIGKDSYDSIFGAKTIRTEIMTDANGNRAEVEVDANGNPVKVIKEL